MSIIKFSAVGMPHLYHGLSPAVVIGTEPVGFIYASYDTMLEIVGTPFELEDEESVRKMWCFASGEMKSINRTVIAFYDFQQNVPIDNVLKWNVSAKNTTMEKVIKYVRSRSDMHYRVKDNTLIITPKT